MHERDILLAALEKGPPEEREAYLREVCGDDAPLRERIESLLRASEVSDRFLETPVLDTEVLALQTDDAGTALPEQEPLDLGFLQPSEGPHELGRLGKYTVTEIVGRGGMGIVLKGRDTQLDRVVAIKVLVPELAANAAARKRFLREAHAAAAVSHDHVVTIFAIEAEKLPYLVMEYIAGQSLQEKINEQGLLGIKEILRIGMQTAFGLAAAHAQGIIHRDIKPANILLQNGIERVRITDFGLARAADDVSVTRTGEVAGTPHYMSPEQAQGLPVDARSDLFSLGCVLYAMCTGRPPFRADSAPAVLHRVCHATPAPIQEINPEIPEWLIAIIERLLRKDPADRFQSAKEVGELLSQYLAHVQQPAIVPCPEPASLSPQGQPAFRFPPWSMALLALLVIALGLGLTEAAGVTKVMPTVIRIVRGEGALVIEIDDPTVQVTLDGESLSIRGAGLQELRLLPGQYRFHASKDGQPVKDEIVTITRGGRETVKVTRESWGRGGSSSMAPAAITLLAKLDGHSDLVRAVAFLPDGRRFLSVGRDKMVRIWDLATRSILSTLPVEGYLRDAHVSADGRLVAMVSNSGDKKGVAQVWDIEKRERLCALVQDVDYSNCIRFSPDGTRVVTIGSPSIGILWDLTTKKEIGRFDVEDRGSVQAIEFSPDGRRLAIGVVGRVRLFDIEGGNVVGDALLPQPRMVLSLAFAPSGKTLACGQMGGHISLIDVELRQATTSLPNSDSNAHVHSVRFLDNDRFLLTTCFDATLRVWDLARTKVVATAATEKGTNKHLGISPDGRYAVTAEGEDWDATTRTSKANGDYALRLWQLPESVWPKASRPTSSSADTTNQTPRAERGAFVVLGGMGVAERKFDTLAEAIPHASDGDTIEIRGNGPFVTEPIALRNALAMRAGGGFQPTLQLDPRRAGPLLTTTGPLVLEGIEFLHQPANDVPVTWSPTLKASGAVLQVANCRFFRKVNFVAPCVYCDRITRAEFRNSQFTQLGGTGSGISYGCPPMGTLLVENCAHSATYSLTLNVDATKVQHVAIRLQSNTWVGQLGIQLVMSGIPKPIPESEPAAAPLVTMESAQNVFDFRDRFMQVDDSELIAAPPPKETLTDACRRFLTWRDEGSLYPRQVLLGVEATKGHHIAVDGQAAWDRFWNLQPTAARSGTPKFQGGDVYALTRTTAQTLGPEAFRLRTDSPGYRAGPGGKDLGANIDLVGPGAAYERWKKLPEYQEWLKNSGQMK